MEGRREKGRNGEGGCTYALTTFLTPTDPPLTPVLTEVAKLIGRERGSESDRTRRRGMARERPERMVPGRVAETES